MVTNHILEFEFNRMNKKYFRGEIEIESVRFKNLGKRMGMTELVWHTRPTTKAERKKEGLSETSWACYYRPRIWIDSKSRTSGRQSMCTLIHEMAHCATWEARKGICNSGRWNSFNKEMLRLAKAGAFNGWW